MRLALGGGMMAKADGGTLSGALDYIGALNVATKITTVIGLAALALIVAFLLSSQWLGARRAAIDRAIEKGDDAALAALLGQVDVPLDTLDPAEKYAMGRDQSRQRFVQKMVWQALLFAGFLALLVFVWALVQPPPPVAGEKISGIQMTQLLTFLPEDQRQAMCEKTLAAATCTEIVASIAGLVRGTPAQKDVAATAIDRGTVSTGLAVALRQLKPAVQIAAGDAKGWDVTVRWCGGLFARRNQQRALEAARTLARIPGERIAAGVTLGRIAVVQTDQPPGGGVWIETDDSSGKDAAVTAIQSTLRARGVDRYGVRATTAKGRWAIAMYECESNVGVRIGRPL